MKCKACGQKLKPIEKLRGDKCYKCQRALPEAKRVYCALREMVKELDALRQDRQKHEVIVGTFSKDLFASFPEIILCFERPCIAYPDPIFGIKTRQGYIFDDMFWDVFHAYPFHICHVAWLIEEEVYEIRFRVNASVLGSENGE